MQREIGLYLVKVFGKWTVAQWICYGKNNDQYRFQFLPSICTHTSSSHVESLIEEINENKII